MAEQANAAQTVLIVDDDLGFVCWLGDIFNEAGCRALPALSCGDAAVVTKRLGVEPDIIAVNPRLAGVHKMLQGCIQTKPHSKIVTIGPPSDAPAAFFHVHATLERPAPSEHLSREEWIEKLRKLLTHVDVATAG